MQALNDPVSLFCQVRVVQRQAERAGFINTATALAAIAEMIALEAAMDVVGPETSLPRTGSIAVGALPIYRVAR